MGFLSQSRPNSEERLNPDNRPLTVGEFRTMLDQATNEIVTKLTAEIFTATSLLKRELPGEILGVMEALETFRAYEEKKSTPPENEDWIAMVRRTLEENRQSRHTEKPSS